MSSYRFCRTDDIALLVDALNRCWAPHCHLLDSLSSKLAILGPPRIVAEVPESLAPACELFDAGGFAREALLTDYVLEWREDGARGPRGQTRRAGSDPDSGSPDSRYVIPVTVDDLAANGLLGDAYAHACWARSVDALTARKDDIAGLAVASDERIEAYLLHRKDGEIVALHSCIEDGEERLGQLLDCLRAQGLTTVRFLKVHPSEVANVRLASLGFHAAGEHRLYATQARSN
jgi:hypothetical protein